MEPQLKENNIKIKIKIRRKINESCDATLSHEGGESRLYIFLLSEERKRKSIGTVYDASNSKLNDVL